MVTGDGPDRERLESLAAERADGRAEFTGRVDEAELASLYARCLAVYYAPVDEDFGMVPYEAFLSEKPVLTTTDAGGPLEVVADGRTGLSPRPTRRRLPRPPAGSRHPDEARAFGLAGRSSPRASAGTRCIERLLA